MPPARRKAAKPATDQAFLPARTASEASEATSISVINDAAKSFGSPAAQAIHPAVARHAKAATKTSVLTHAAFLAQAKPFSMSKPQSADNAPNVPPDMSAVLAPAGFDKYPAIPQRIRKIPNPANHRPQKFIG